MLATLLQTGSQPQHISLAETRQRSNRHQAWLTFRECSGLIHDENVDLGQCFQRFGIADEDTRCRATAGPDHDGHGRRKPECTGTSNDQDGDCIEQRIGHPGLWAVQCPHHKRHCGHQHNNRHKVTCHDIGQPLNRRPGALSFADHAHDLCQ